MLADEILHRAKRIVRLEQLRDRAVARLAHEKKEYRALIEKLQERPTSDLYASVPSASLRNRILGFLEGQQNEVRLDRIQEVVDEPREKTIWTLANLKRSGHVLNPKRGYWRINRDDKEGAEIDHEPEVTKRFE